MTNFCLFQIKSEIKSEPMEEGDIHPNSTIKEAIVKKEENADSSDTKPVVPESGISPSIGVKTKCSTYIYYILFYLKM